MRQRFKIGEVARLFGINVRTLRYYDTIGLLKPVVVDRDTGYRYYSAEQFEQLNTIRYLRTQGISLAQIQAHLHQREPQGILEMLRSQQHEAQRHIEALEQARDRLAARVAQIEDALRPDLLGRVRRLELPRRPVALLRRALRAGDDLELPLRHLENAAGLAPSYFLGKVGLTVAREDLLSGQWDTYSSLFCQIEPGEAPAGREGPALPGGPWAALRFTGTHSQAAPHYGELLLACRQQGLQPAGDAAEFTLVDYGLTEDPAQFVTEIQIPVKPA